MQLGDPEIRKALDEVNVTSLDRHFAEFASRLARVPAPEVALAAALVSNYTARGHICLNLLSLAGNRLPDELCKERCDLICPPYDVWMNVLLGSGVVGRPGEFKPMVFAAPNLYLHRYWEYENMVENFIILRGSKVSETFDPMKLRSSMERVFPVETAGTADWQKVAVFAAVSRQFCVITGGPGTGKTTTIARMLALLLEQSRGNSPALRILLSAPTGKAAARLQGALIAAKEWLSCGMEIKDAIPEKASTVHRLLGYQPYNQRYAYNSENPLPADVVIVDEASMVDLPLMAKLMMAVPEKSLLILLGDRDQLASVEPGSVLGDVCDPLFCRTFSRQFVESFCELSGDAFEPEIVVDKNTFGDSVVALQKSYRFGPDSGIGAVSRAVVKGEGQKALSLLEDGAFQDIRWHDLPQSPSFLNKMLTPKVLQQYGRFSSSRSSPQQILASLDSFIILCALRQGAYGAESVNQLVREILSSSGIVDGVNDFYHGKPVMIKENSYELGLYNGDTGIMLTDSDSEGQLRVFFPGHSGVLKRIAPMRLPSHSLAYAVTVHKSQGSEFDNVLVILPDTKSAVLTRELLYTALTRAKKSVEIWGRKEVFTEAVRTRINRESGLRRNLAAKNFFSV